MRLNRLDLNLLVALDVLLEERSVTRASKRLALTQPATSNALTRLRQYFGDPLLEQRGRDMVATTFGRELAAPVREIVLRAAAITGARTNFDPGTSERRFIVNVSDYVALFLMTAVLRRLAVEAPGVVLILESSAEGARDRFESGAVDMIVTPERFAIADHPHDPLFEERYCCVTWGQSAKYGDRLSLDEYESADHVVAYQRDPANAPYHAHARRIVGTSPTYTQLPYFIVGTDRVATVHERVARRLAGQLDLRVSPPPFPIPPLVEVVQWHRLQDDDRATCWFRTLLAQEAARL